MDTNTDILAGRRGQVYRKGASVGSIECDKQSLAGSVSQRACVFCGSRVVLYPVADALHLVHGPIGCAAYTWDIRGALSSGPELHRMSFSTDLCEQDVIYGGESKLEASLRELIERYDPRAAFVYVTCIVGLIGDDVDAVCSRVEGEVGIPVIPVHSPGFSGTKKTGYLAACEALYRLVGTGDTSGVSPLSINIVGEFNIAGEAWLIRRYYERMGLQVVSIMTGDGRVDDIRRSHGAALNVVQCSGSMMNLALMMQERYGTPCIHVSYFGPQDMAAALYAVADHFDDEDVSARTRDLVRQETAGIMPEMMSLRKRLRGKRAAVYTGGAFKALSLVRSLRTLGIKTVMAGSQTGSPDDYELLQGLCDDGAVLLDDTNPVEIARFVQETGVDLLIGGVKERPIAFKLGLAFVDHNHERKTPLAGFEGALNFAHEVYASVCSPVWKLHPGPARRGGTA